MIEAGMPSGEHGPASRGGGIVFQGSPKYGVPSTSASYMLKSPSEEDLGLGQDRLGPEWEQPQY